MNKALENAEAEQVKQQEEGSTESEKEESLIKKTKFKAEKEDSPVISEHKSIKLPKTSIAATRNAQSSYIMKLFDRSVNLAKFTEDSPLYPYL